MDRRMIRTLKALSEALVRLMNKQEWGRISVQNICDEADVARSTFYAHFENKQELLNHCFATLEIELLQANHSHHANETLSFLPELLDHIKATRAIFNVTANTETGTIIFGRFRLMIETLVEKELGDSEKVTPHHIVFLSGGIFAVLERWSRAGCREPVEAMLTTIRDIFSRQSFNK